MQKRLDTRNAFMYLSTMKELIQLKKHYGTWAKVAQVIGITYRHVINARRGKCGRFLKMRIRQISTDIKNQRI